MKFKFLLKPLALLLIVPMTAQAEWYNQAKPADPASAPESKRYDNNKNYFDDQNNRRNERRHESRPSNERRHSRYQDDDRDDYRHREARTSLDVSVISSSRGKLKEYEANSRGRNQRSYVVARDNDNYKIKIRNNSNNRIGVVVTVDGRNIISGKKSYLKSTERMYVLKPWKTETLSGWRRNKNKVNRFYFTSANDSYAEAWGDQSAMGVIAVAAFKEKRPHYENDYRRKSAPSAKRSASDKAGTGYGESKYSPSRKVSFKARKKAFERHFIKYEWRKSLCRKGVIRCYDDRPHHQENRFWDDDDDYAPPPRQIRKQMIR